MDFAFSARKHGISEGDVLHALRHPLVVVRQEFEGELRGFVIGADKVGALLEIVVVPLANPSRVIHADRLRRKYFHLLGM